MALILQPAGSPGAYEHYNDTIENPVELSDPTVEALLGSTLVILERIFPDGKAPMWGIVPSKLNKGKYDRLSEGDRVVFSRNKKIYSTGIVAHKFENYELSKYLWDIDDRGATWSLMYALRDVKEVDISYVEFNRAVGYKENYTIQGFNILSDGKSERFEQKFFPEREVKDNAPPKAGHWEELFPNTWLLFSLGDDDFARNAGNEGYDDTVEEVYRYDSNVGNSKRLAAGDVIVLRSRKSLIGIAKIQRIDAIPGKKQLNRCPYCKKTSIKKRMHISPEFRCDKCKKEFELPLVDRVDVINYSAWYKDTFLSCPNAIPISLLLKACVSQGSQQSMRKMVLGKLLPLLQSLPETAFVQSNPYIPDWKGNDDRDEPEPEIDEKDEPEIMITIDGEVIEIGKENDQLYPGLGWEEVTEEMIPQLSDQPSLMDSDEQRLRVLVDGASARCLIDDVRMGTPKIVILFDDPHPLWPSGVFSTKNFLFEEPGVMKWGYGEEPMQIFTLPDQGKQAQSQPGYFSLTISATQLRKSTINANRGIRDALLENRLIDYKTIAPGRTRRKACRLIFGGKVIETKASFLIPRRRGKTSPEPRFWPYKLNRYTKPNTELHFLATTTKLIVSDSPENLES